jgi:hypothetical protein
MKTLRHYFISDNLDDIDLLEEQLEAGGISSAQIHVLSKDEVGVARHIHLHEVASLLRQDMIHSAQVGAMFGFVAAVLIIAVAWALDLPDEIAGWAPYALLSIIVFGLCIWEGGLFGIQEPNHHYRQFEAALEQGKHVFFVDLDKPRERILTELLNDHPTLQLQSMESGVPQWMISGQNRLVGFLDRNLLSQSQI